MTDEQLEAVAQAVARALGQKPNGKPNGNGDGPWWSRTLWQIGPLAAGFFFLLMVIAGYLPSPLFLIEGLNARTVTSLRILRQLCRHTAPNDWTRGECDRD